jgi:antitoxin (DNA-binding transcriptional repressor) of toxin-antitoxin stability system
MSSVGAVYQWRMESRFRLYEALLFRGDRDLQRGRAYGAAKKWDAHGCLVLRAAKLTSQLGCFKLLKMSETTIPAAEAAKDFLRLLESVERKGETAVIVRDGKRVATLSPLPAPALTCAELADRWLHLGRLDPDEASAFADDLEQARAGLPQIRPAWD